jgi:hypothetical protein
MEGYMGDKNPKHEFKYFIEDFVDYLKGMILPILAAVVLAVYGRYEKYGNFSGRRLNERDHAPKIRTFQKYNAGLNHAKPMQNTYISGGQDSKNRQGLPFFNVKYDTLDSKLLN